MNKPKKARSIRFKLVLYFSVFTVLTLLFLFVFQTCFLDLFYRQLKIDTVKNAARAVASFVDTDELSDVIDSWAMQEQLSICMAMQDGSSVLSSSEQSSSLTKAELQRLYEAAAQNGGELLQKSRVRVSLGDSSKPEKPRPADPKERTRDGKLDRQDYTGETICCAYLTLSDTGITYMVVVTTLLSPVDATVKTLQTQLIFAALILIVASVVLALIVSRRIASPIVSVNRSAKLLATDRYEPSAAGGYREIEELCRTLDETAVTLDQNNRLQQELVANISHDLRTPLTMITGYSEAIRDLPGENSAENIQVVIDEAERLTRLVNDVLDLSKLQSGAQRLTLDTVDLTEIVRETVCRCEQMTAQDGYHIRFEADGCALVRADALRLSQVVYNLLGNALTYTGEDRTVTVCVETVDEAVKVSFRDSGEGISPEQMEHIWERYYRADKEHRRATIGTGLGLSIVRSVVQLHGGTCGAESKEGAGSVFWFSLPLEK